MKAKFSEFANWYLGDPNCKSEISEFLVSENGDNPSNETIEHMWNEVVNIRTKLLSFNGFYEHIIEFEGHEYMCDAVVEYPEIPNVI